MPNRLIINGTDATVTVNSLSVPARQTRIVNVASDADVVSWVATTGIAVMAAGAATDYQSRRNVARRLKYNIPDEVIS